MVGGTATRELQGQFPNQIIRASAGTGKTFALSNRYLRLLASGAECHTILATTFTKKGAGEILDRIVNRLSDAALDDDAANQLSEELEWKLTRPRAANILHELLGNLHRLEISTLDSFFNRVAKAFALELGLNPNWDIVDEQQINQLQDESIQTVLRDGNTINLLHMLSKGDATRRVASMVRDTVEDAYEIYRESGPEPWDQVAVTGKFLSDEKLDAIIAQMEALELPNKQLPEHWAKVTAFVKQDDWDSVIKATSFQRSLDGDFKFGRTKLPPEIIEIYQKLIPHCRAFVEHRLSSQNKSTRDLLSAFGLILEQRKNETGYLRFDDITQRLEDFVADTGADHFAFRLDHQIQHLLLDEFQDTSLSQWKIIRPFANNVTQSTDTLRSFFCVGDMKQAIYGWRGGVAEIFDLVDQELANLDPTKPLTTSYRSAQPVIDLVNRVFSNVDQYRCGDEATDKAIRDWTQWFKEHSTQKQDLKGCVSIEMAHDCDPSQKSDANRKDKSRNQNVITAAVERVRSVLQQAPEHHSVGVIVRTNDQVNDLISRLRQAGIAASEEGGSSLVDSAAVELVLSAIQLADHPGDSIARFHLSHSPLASSLGLEPETDTNGRANAESAQASAARLRNKFARLGYGQAVEWLASHLIPNCTRRERLRLQQLVRVAYESQTDDQRWKLRPSQFVQYVRDEVKIGDQSAARVRVMTIHKCKGLEFDVVVLPIMLSSRGWAGKEPAVVIGRDQPTEPIKIATRHIGSKLQKLMPKHLTSIFEQDRQRNVRESMCVLYVALTRAVHATHIILSHGAKPEHKSESGILLATVCPDAPREQGVIYQAGDEHWYRENTKKNKQDRFDLAKFYSLDVSKKRPHTVSQQVRSGRGLGWDQPSDLEGDNNIQLSEIFARIENQEAFLRGTMLHACFEQIKWLDQSVPSKQELEMRLKSMDATIDRVTPFIDLFESAIERPNIKDILALSTYPTTLPDHLAKLIDSNADSRIDVRNEFRFAVETNAGLMEGIIDRLVLIHRGQQIVAADIIEFKSDEINHSNLAQRVQYHQPQLDAYRDAICQMTGLGPERVLTRLVFLSSGDVVEPKTTSPPVNDRPNVPAKTEASPNFKRPQQQTLWSDDV